MNRHQRRQAEREARRREKHPHPTSGPIELAPGGRMQFTGEYERADGASGPLPPKVPGEHRWMLLSWYAITEDAVRNEADGGGERTYLDHRNRLGVAIGCFDCEQQYPEEIGPGTRCPAGAELESGLYVPGSGEQLR